jgi:hypothetical protein
MYGISGVNFHELGERLAEIVLDTIAEAIGSELLTKTIREGHVEVYIPGWEHFLSPIAFGSHRPFVGTSGLPCIPGARDGTTLVRERLRGILLDIQDRLSAGIRQERMLVLAKMDSQQASQPTTTTSATASDPEPVVNVRDPQRRTKVAMELTRLSMSGELFPGSEELAEQLGCDAETIRAIIRGDQLLTAWTKRETFQPEKYLSPRQLELFRIIDGQSGHMASFDTFKDIAKWATNGLGWDALDEEFEDVSDDMVANALKELQNQLRNSGVDYAPTLEVSKKYRRATLTKPPLPRV